MRRFGLLPLFFVAAVAVAGCGSSSKSKTHASQPTTSTPSTAAASTQTAPTTTSPSALQAEANSAAAGDIPDNQVFLGFRDAAAGYSIKYPEGWAQQGAGARVTIRDKNNIIRVVVTRAAAPSAGTIRHELASLQGAHVRSGPTRITIGGAPAFKVVYATQSAPNAVTGKRVTLVVDRYYLSHAGKEAIVDLGSPVGVDNVDAYRLIIQSFRWR
ncbi:MAG: hypothetical protein WBB74_12975 [Gaiellaceae bacterium]